MPYLTRNGCPVATLRSSFLRNSGSVSTCSVPRWIRASCSSTDFMSAPLRVAATRASLVHLEPPDGLKGMDELPDVGFAPAGGPVDGDDVETGGPTEQAVAVQKVQGRLGQAALFDCVHGLGRPAGVWPFRRADLHEHQAVAVQGNDVEFADRAGVVADQYAQAVALQVAGGGALGARAEPAPPPRPARRRRHDLAEPSAGA